MMYWSIGIVCSMLATLGDQKVASPARGYRVKIKIFKKITLKISLLNNHALTLTNSTNSLHTLLTLHNRSTTECGKNHFLSNISGNILQLASCQCIYRGFGFNMFLPATYLHLVAQFHPHRQYDHGSYMETFQKYPEKYYITWVDAFWCESLCVC